MTTNQETLAGQACNSYFPIRVEPAAGPISCQRVFLPDAAMPALARFLPPGMPATKVAAHLMRLYRWCYGPYWLTVFLDREHRILGEVCSVREEVSEIAVARHSLVGWQLGNDDPPPFGVVQFLSRKHLHAAAEKSRLCAWIADRFRKVPDDGLWLGFAEPMTGDWIAAMEADDVRRVKQCLEEEKRDAALTVPEVGRRLKGLETLIEEGRLGEALVGANLFAEEAPRSVQAACMEGLAYQVMGLHDKAGESYRRCLELYRKELARGCRRARRLISEELVDSLDTRTARCQSAALASTWAASSLSAMLEQEGKKSEACEVLRVAFVDMFGRDRVAEDYAGALERGERYSEAADVYRYWAERGPTDVKRWLDLAYCSGSAGRYRDAAAAARIALNLENSEQVAHHCLGLALLDLCEKERVFEPASFGGQLAFGFYGEVVAAEAVGHFRRIREISANEGVQMMFAKVGFSAYVAGAYSVAAELFRLHVKTDPTSHLSWNNLAMCCIQFGRLEEAQEYCRKALELNSDVAALWDTAGFVKLRMGRYAEAVTLLQTALKISPAHQAAWQNLGCAYQALGNTAEAEVARARAAGTSDGIAASGRQPRL